MSSEPPHDATSSDDGTRPRLRLVAEPQLAEGTLAPAAARPRSIGRLIAQTALIADSAVTRRQAPDSFPGSRGVAGRLLGRFR